MKVTIHQPQYFPYPGFFHKLNMVDTYVIMDNTQYDQRYTNRNKIMSTSGTTWISIPLMPNQKFLPNRLVKINNDISWRKLHWDKIRYWYKNSKFFSLYENYFSKLYKKEWELLLELNVETLRQTIDWLGIRIKIVRESELMVDGKGTERLVNICNKVGADTYISGIGPTIDGKKQLDENLFDENNIKLIFQDYTPKIYPQNKSKSFIPNLSIIDLLFNMGPDSLKCITR